MEKMELILPMGLTRLVAPTVKLDRLFFSICIQMGFGNRELPISTTPLFKNWTSITAIK